MDQDVLSAGSLKWESGILTWWSQKGLMDEGDEQGEFNNRHYQSRVCERTHLRVCDMLTNF